MNKTPEQVMQERGLDPNADSISFEEFEAVGLPPIVQCCGCTMTMSFLSCIIQLDTDGLSRTFCSDCLDVEDV